MNTLLKNGDIIICFVVSSLDAIQNERVIWIKSRINLNELGLTQIERFCQNKKMAKLTHLDYCQFLLVSQINYTQTYFADHSDHLTHDDVNRLMREAKLSPRELRNRVRTELILSSAGYILFDDVVLDKNHSFSIEVVRRVVPQNSVVK